MFLKYLYRFLVKPKKHSLGIDIKKQQYKAVRGFFYISRKAATIQSQGLKIGLKYPVDSLDGLDDSVASLYEQTENGFELSVDGFHSHRMKMSQDLKTKMLNYWQSLKSKNSRPKLKTL